MTIKLLITALITTWITTGSIYDYSVPKITGGNYDLNASQGKKILIVTIPVAQNQQTDSLLYSLDTLAAAHASELTVIAVPSYEDGFTLDGKAEILTYLQTKLHSPVIITDGLYTRKTSNSHQSGLFKWLTDIDRNEYFDVDMAGPGYKFFIDGSGQLYGLLVPQTSMAGPAVYKTIKMY